MNAAAPIVSKLQLEWRVALPILAGCGVFIWLCFHFTLEWYWCLPGVIAILFLAGLVGKQIKVDLSRKLVQERHLLLGRMALSSHEYHFFEFDGVVSERYDESGDTGRRMMRVGLRHRSGKTFWLRFFYIDSSGRNAGEFAWRLSCDTGIEIRE